MAIQNYEEYWKLTLEYTDFNDEKFLETLQIIVDRIDTLNHNQNYIYQSTDYQQLQNDILALVPKTSSIENQLASTRKAINQCVKLGFVNPKLKSYHKLTKEYLQAKTNRKRKDLFSKIVYSNSKFNSSTTEDKNCGNQINFLIKTLEEVGVLTKSDVYAMMLIDIATHEKGFADRNDLDYYKQKADEIGFLDRKYNQYDYLINVLGKLDEIDFVKKSKKEKDFELYFTEDAKRIFGENLELEAKKRDPYLHMLYKIKLKQESYSVYQAEKCMVERLDYPILIASHIKPFNQSNDFEAYDVNNGILLSRNFDSLFDLGYITFDTDGKIIVSTQISDEVKTHISEYQFDRNFINPKRLEYLEYHRNNVFRKCG